MSKLNGKKIAILTEDGFEEVELTSPKKALENEGATVHIVSPKKDKVRAKQGDEWSTDYPVDVVLGQANPLDYDALVLPGGVINPDKLRINENALNFIKGFANANKPIASICHGPQTLIDAELVHGKKMTSVTAIKKDLINAGVDWIDQSVVVDQNFISSRTPEDLPDFNSKIIEILL